jgi:hypothetical protein
MTLVVSLSRRFFSTFWFWEVILQLIFINPSCVHEFERCSMLLFIASSFRAGE